MDYFRRRKPITEEELQQKIAELSPELQAEFLRASDLILQKESEIFLDIIRNSRDDINVISHEIKNEQTAFKASSSKFDGTMETKISTTRAANDKLTDFVKKRQQTRKVTNTLQETIQNKEKEAVDNYLKAVGRSKVETKDNTFDAPSYSRPTTGGTRPGTAFRIRFDAMQSPQESQDEETIRTNDANYNTKQEELLSKMKEQDNQVLSERERQKKLIEKRKAEKQNKKVNAPGGLAADLIDQSREVGEKQNQTKLQQEKNIQDRLEKIKSNRPQVSGMEERPPNDMAFTPNSSGGMDRSPEPHQKSSEIFEMRTPTKSGWSDNNADEGDPSKMERKHSKKKHHHHKKKDRKKDDIQLENINNDGIDCLTIE